MTPTASAPEHPLGSSIFKIVLIPHDHIDLEFVLVSACFHHLLLLIELFQLTHNELAHHPQLLTGHGHLRATDLVLLSAPHLEPLDLSLQLLRHLLEHLRESPLRLALEVYQLNLQVAQLLTQVTRVEQERGR